MSACACAGQRTGPALFCGDTLFNAGAGNCHNGGDPGLLYETFVDQLARLPDSTRVYPGHEYMTRNLAFTVDREPGNAEAASALETARSRWSQPPRAITTLGEEKTREHVLPVCRTRRSSRDCALGFDIGETPDARTVFIKLRELRNSW